ncbi:hypothetical protein TSUD_40020 [Trifolium subterraneum]|uniref:Uncharacterized protein n=1 Tax=Trifolium subterraneum TaxID=3900 RepID=A0A2Z6M0K4_TRISU|nr:hypothetical protein TSUD_40020 [Trifolium subterraneum]
MKDRAGELSRTNKDLRRRRDPVLRNGSVRWFGSGSRIKGNVEKRGKCYIYSKSMVMKRRDSVLLKGRRDSSEFGRRWYLLVARRGKREENGIFIFYTAAGETLTSTHTR